MRDAIQAEIEAFVASYRDAFERSHVEGILEHFADSLHIASDTGAAVRVDIVNRTEWRAIVEQLVARYRALGVAHVTVRSLATCALSPRLGQATVRWALIDRNGDALYEFSALYTLIGESSAWRIVAIAHDEIARTPPRTRAP